MNNIIITMDGGGAYPFTKTTTSPNDRDHFWLRSVGGRIREFLLYITTLTPKVFLKETMHYFDCTLVLVCNIVNVVLYGDIGLNIVGFIILEQISYDNRFEWHKPYMY